MRYISQKYPIPFSRNIISFTLSLILMLIGCMNYRERSTPQISSKKHTEYSYFANGQLEYEAEYLNGKLDGMSRNWSINGELLSQAEYSNGNPHGIWKTYHFNGSMMSEVNYFHGKMHGIEKWYHENGTIKSEQVYDYGNPIGKPIRWKQDGSIIY